MSNRWKPNNSYYIIDIAGNVNMYTWADDDVDVLYHKFGNCFETREQAEAASAKVKELLLGMSVESGASSAQFPKLTAEVFERPDCPKWAKYAAVDQSGYAYWFETEPVEGELQTDRTGAWGSHDNKKIITGLWDSSDWLNSLIERPEKSYPRLTEEVFDRPDCPRWAQYAAVDEDGTVALFEQRPTIALVGKWWDREGKYCPLDGRYDNLNWRNSLIERPAKLPAWCKVDAMGWHKRCGYFKVTYIDDVSKRVDIQQVGEKSRGYFSFHTICNETVQANPRPYNEEEMQKLVGKVLELDGNRDLVTSYDGASESVYADAMWMNSDELLSNGYTIDGELCRVLEHLEGDNWVK